MADGKSILVDTSRCTACRGCQVACKQWNGLPGTKTEQLGSYQNPQDLSADTWKLVRFAEGRKDDGKPFWYFFSDQCRHCIDPPCMDAMAGYVEGGAVRDEATGAILYTDKSSQAPLEEVRSSCPYNIPRQNAETKVFFKCTLCSDRLANGMTPACVLSCPTGALMFGERDEILAAAAKRVDELKKANAAAMAVNPNDVRVIYIVTDDPRRYYEYAAG